MDITKDMLEQHRNNFREQAADHLAKYRELMGAIGYIEALLKEMESPNESPQPTAEV